MAAMDIECALSRCKEIFQSHSTSTTIRFARKCRHVKVKLNRCGRNVASKLRSLLHGVVTITSK